MTERFLLDANVFIEAGKRYYGHDICPGFWTAIAEQNKSQRLHSIDWVREELIVERDELSEWAETSVPPDFFKGSQDPQVIERYRILQTWVQSQPNFNQPSKAKFAKGADAWLIAYAGVNSMTVVTQEVAVTKDSWKIKIPNVCSQFQIPCVDVIAMLRRLGERFVRQYE